VGIPINIICAQILVVLVVKELSCLHLAKLSQNAWDIVGLHPHMHFVLNVDSKHKLR